MLLVTYAPNRPRLALLLVAAAALASCAVGRDDTRGNALSVSSSDLPSIPICREEMRAYVEITKLAKLHGEGWAVYAPAVDALKQQILNCLDESTGTFRAL